MTDTPGTLEERQNDKPPTHWHPDSKSELQPQSEGEWDWREDRHDNDALGRSKRRLRFAWCLADPHAPDQMALVLRVDLGRVLAKLTQYTAHREMLMKSKTEAADEIASLRARVAKLEGALDPFATATEDIDENEPGDINMWEHPASMNVYISDFRDARQALKDTPVE